MGGRIEALFPSYKRYNFPLDKKLLKGLILLPLDFNFFDSIWKAFIQSRAGFCITI